MSADVDRTGRRIVAGIWGCAAITMVGSAVSAAIAYDFLGEHAMLGFATGIAVDIALCVALVGDRRLYAHGLSSNWGRALRITTALMSLVLNSGVAFATGRYFLGVLHAFLPVLLVVLTEYGQDVLLKFAGLQRARDAQIANDVGDFKAEPVEESEVASPPIASVPAVVDPSPSASVTQLPSPRQATAQDRRRWIESRIIAGHEVTGREVEQRFGSRNGAREVAQVLRNRREESKEA